MVAVDGTIRQFAHRQYKWGFHSDIDSDTVSPGLNEDLVRVISAKKNDFILAAKIDEVHGGCIAAHHGPTA